MAALPPSRWTQVQRHRQAINGLEKQETKIDFFVLQHEEEVEERRFIAALDEMMDWLLSAEGLRAAQRSAQNQTPPDRSSNPALCFAKDGHPFVS